MKVAGEIIFSQKRKAESGNADPTGGKHDKRRGDNRRGVRNRVVHDSRDIVDNPFVTEL